MPDAILQTHDHIHSPNRFAVIPTPLRLGLDETHTGRGVTIALLDSGFYPHPDLAEPPGRLLAHHDVTGEENVFVSSPQSWHWHGTMVATVAAGSGLLSDGIYRSAAPRARLVLVKVSERGRITEEAIARGIEWVIANRARYGIRVLNLSLGGDQDVPCAGSMIDRAAEEAVREGIVVVVAAGNSGDSERPRSIPPANSPSVITVGGYDDHNGLSAEEPGLYHSNFGPTADGTVKPEIIAPAMWVAAPILPGTDLYRSAEHLSELAAAPDYLLRRKLHEQWRVADLPASILTEETGAARELIEGALRERKIVAAHYQHADGTSFAAPLVSSIVARMIEANPQLTPAAIKHILISTADRLRHAPLIRQGYGMINAARAIEAAAREKHVAADAGYMAPRVEGPHVHFFYHDDAAHRVALAGDFNNWDAAQMLFERNREGIWRARCAVPPPGRYRYKFIIDGTRWTEDPSHGLKEPDGFGGFNSVLHIT